MERELGFYHKSIREFHLKRVVWDVHTYILIVSHKINNPPRRIRHQIPLPLRHRHPCVVAASATLPSRCHRLEYPRLRTNRLRSPRPLRRQLEKDALISNSN